MDEESAKSYTEIKKKSITGDASADHVLWRLSTILREIAKSATTEKSKPPSGRRKGKAPASKKEVNSYDNIM